MRKLAPLAALLLALTACGGGDPDSGDLTAGLPDCSDVWQDGETLPDDYEGCMGDGAIQAAITYDCEDGSKLTAYRDSAYATYGGPITEIKGDDMAADRGWARAVDAC